MRDRKGNREELSVFLQKNKRPWKVADSKGGMKVALLLYELYYNELLNGMQYTMLIVCTKTTLT
jgi:hypothetical protein